MRILFLTMMPIEDVNSHGIYPDLVRALSVENDVYVVSPREKKLNLPTELREYYKITLLNVRTGNIFNVRSLWEKGISTLTIEKHFFAAIRKHLAGKKFDLIIYTTPPITFNALVQKLKKVHGAKSLLLLKDIFPQNAIDLGIIGRRSILGYFFRRMEKKLYELSDFIGCMSEGNRKYLLQHNSYLKSAKVFVSPNCIEINNLSELPEKTKDSIFEKYGLSSCKTTFIYGGNIGLPQGIPFILDCVEAFNHLDAVQMVIIGEGSGYEALNNKIKSSVHSNVTLIKYLPNKEYEAIVRCCDVGLVFLDARFTIPNFPSRILSYMEAGLPILAATDNVTDIKELLIDNSCGLWCESDNVAAFVQCVMNLSKNTELRCSMGKNARQLLEDRYSVDNVIREIITRVEA